jgi:hypothetical protein
VNRGESTSAPIKRPSFQFYPGDWLGNAKLRRCSDAAQGVWMRVLCLMHDSDEIGVLRWPLADIGAAIGAPMELLLELVRKGVMKGCDSGAFGGYEYVPRIKKQLGDPVCVIEPCDGPVWLSSRMVRDSYINAAKAMHGPKGAEYGHLGGEFGRRGGRPSTTAMRNTPQPADEEAPIERGQKPPPSSSSSTSSFQTTKAPTSSTSARPKGNATPIPEGFSVSPAIKAWAQKYGFDQLDAHLENFVTTCKAHNYRYVDHDAAFMNAIRKNWAKVVVANTTRASPDWWTTTQGVKDKALELGVSFGECETWNVFCAKVFFAAGDGPWMKPGKHLSWGVENVIELMRREVGEALPEPDVERAR